MSSPSSGDDTTVVVVVFVSFGGIFFLAFILVGLMCLIKKSRQKKMAKEIDIVKVAEHLKVNEAIIDGPHGKQAVVLNIEDDVHVRELIGKAGLQGEAVDGIGESSSGSAHHHILHHKP